MKLDQFFAHVQKTSLPGVWSKGVALSRSDAIVKDSQTEEEIVLRVRSKEHPVSRKVTLWPIDEDWYCDCEDRNDVCAHVAAAVIALKSGKVGETQIQTAVNPASPSTPAHVPAHTEVQYHFKEVDSAISFERWIEVRSQSNDRAQSRRQLLQETLVAFAGGISSGRNAFPQLAATKEDYAVDTALGQKKSGIFSATDIAKLFVAVSRCSSVVFEDQPISVSPQSIKIRAEVVDERDGFRIRQIEDVAILRKFRNGAVLYAGSGGGTKILRAVEIPLLTAEERDYLSGDGRWIARKDTASFVGHLLPGLQKKLTVDIRTTRLPELRNIPPRVVLTLQTAGEPPTLFITPKLIYPEIDLPSPAAEEELKRALYSTLGLTVGQTSKFQGESAVEMTSRVQHQNLFDRVGDVTPFAIRGELVGHLELQENGFKISFRSSGGDTDPNTVLRAWRENKTVIPLLGGGWATLPQDWLNRFGEKIETLLNLKLAGTSHITSSIPKYLIPELIDTCDLMGQEIPDFYKTLRDRIRNIEKIPLNALPADLTATLRPYQQQGVNWLCFLRDMQMGAMLADDMGLGKTLQALCAIRGKTLIIAPTSVLPSWENQIRNFRPGLSVCVYHGSNRKLDRSKDVVLSSYALLRLDRGEICAEKWDSVVLDETQMIKNPDSQAAQAAHSLRADFKVALSGTPIENRIEDLESQFKFLNPGLLDGTELREIQKKIKPFILRRLKRDVAPELPPKTQAVLYCELSTEERDVYNALLAATRSDVLEKLEHGASIFAALELLLRLRQACCHTALVPGMAKYGVSSSKVDLLSQTLEQSVGLGHRALVFSQWTSYLDLIEVRLKEDGITWIRLDGSTQNREQVVADFQNPQGPNVMLISLKAGGMGLTLTAADHVFIMDPWWNPSVEEQAADRAHRIGQVNPVLIHRLIAQNTIEERILELQKSKTQLATQVLEGTLSANSLTRNDLLNLLRDI